MDGVTQVGAGAAGADADAGVALGDPAGATQLLDDEAVGVALADPAGATQLPGAEAVAVAGMAVAPVGVDCSLASRVADGAPSTGKAWACSKPEIAARVLGPI